MDASSEFAQQLVVAIDKFTSLPETDQRKITVSVITEIAERALRRGSKARHYGNIFEQMTGAPIRDFRSVEEVKEMIKKYLNDWYRTR